MKPELKAMVDAAEKINPSRTEVDLQAALLAALHWRGNELWYGPFQVGQIRQGHARSRTEFSWYQWGQTDGTSKDADEARDALMSAAQEQIRQWFKEQGE